MPQTELTQTTQFIEAEKGVKIQIMMLSKTIRVWNYGDEVKVLPLFDMTIADAKLYMTQLNAAITDADARLNPTP